MPQQQPTTINNITNNNNTQVINQYIVQLRFGEEDFSRALTEEQFFALMDDHKKGLKRTEAIASIMYNSAPNNATRITNMNQPFCITMGEDGEEKKSTTAVIEEIINQLPRNARKMFISLLKRDEFSEEYYRNVDEMVDDIKKQIKDQKHRKELVKMIKAILYNNNK